REPGPAADQGPDPAADLLRRLQRDDDLRGDRPAAAGVLRAGARRAPGRAPASGCRGAGRGAGRARVGPGGAASGPGAQRGGQDPGQVPRPRHLARRADLRRLRMSRAARDANQVRPVMLMAGGTGGHIFPALAVAHELRAMGVPVVWLGAAGAMETRLVPQHGIEIDTLPVAGVRGKGGATLLAAPLRLLRAVRAASAVLRRRRPRAVIGFGGFASGPGGLAARLAGVPLLVHEQNRAPGMTNRVLARISRRTLSGFPGAFA